MEDEQDEGAPVVGRVERRVRVEITTRIDGWIEPYLVIDLSSGGAFVAGSPQLPVDTELELELELPEEPLRCRAVVKWVRERRLNAVMREGMGVAFVDLSELDRERVAKILEETDG